MAGLLQLSTNISKLARPTRESFLGGRRGATAYEEEMRRFVEPIKEEEVKKRNRRTLWNVITDVLQVGNFASANVVNSITDSIQYGKPLGEAAWDAIRAAARGLTFQEKNTFRDVIKQNAEEHGSFLGKTLEEWEEPLWGDPFKGEKKIGKLANKLLGNKDWAGIAGFAGDVLLDPLTYISPLKALKPTGYASKAARSAATGYADVMTKLGRAGATLGDLQGAVKMGKGGVVGRTAARQADLGYKKLFKEGLMGTPEGLKAKATAAFKNVEDLHMQKTFDELGAGMLELPESFARTLPEVQRFSGMEDLAQTIEKGFGGAGQRAMRLPFLGEVGEHARGPNVAARGMQRLGDLMKSGATGKGLAKFGDAWWSFMNGKSPAAMLKRAFGVRNPYQEYLNVNWKRGGETIRDVEFSTMHQKLREAAVKLGPELEEKARSARAILAHIELRKGGAYKEGLEKVFGGSDDFVYNMRQVLGGSENWDSTIKALKEQGIDAGAFENLKALNISKADAEKITQFWEDIDPALKMMRDKERKLIEEGIFTVEDMGEIKNYLPGVKNRMVGRKGKILGSPAPGHTLAKKLTTRGQERESIELIKTFFGDWIETEAKASGKRIDDIAREIMLEGNFSPLETDLMELLNARITAHARMMGRGEMIRNFKQLGISEQMLGTMSKSNPGIGGMFNQLEGSTDPALKNLLFDKDVKDIVDKTFAVMASDDTMHGIKKLFNNYLSWWKGTATATTGFHLRNHYSNSLTGFFRHGVKWFDLRLDKEAMAAVQYALHPTRYVDVLTKQFADVKEGWVRRALNKEVGGKTLKEMAEESVDDGVVSLHTRLGNISKKGRFKVPIGERAKPWKQEFALPATSRQLGSYIENHARMKSYLLTRRQLAKSGVESTAARNWAKLDTKKWFIDYGDLTEFEQQHLKGPIPFYTWLRKNLANQVAGLMLMPEGYRVMAKIEDAVSIDDFDYTLIPEYMKQANWLPIAQGPEGPTMWWPNFPYADLNKIPLFFEGEGLEGLIPRPDPGAIVEEFTSAANPLLKTLGQSVTKKNLFKKRDFLDRVPAPLGQIFTNSPKVIEFIDGAMKAIGFENGAGVSERNGRLEIDEGLEQILNANIPLLRAFGKIFDMGLDVTGLEEVIEDATGRKDQYSGMEDLFQNLSYFAGAKFREEDESYRAEQMAKEIEQQAQKDRSAWKRTLPGYSQRALQYSLQRDARRRRIGL
jgi:hypothetical protein